MNGFEATVKCSVRMEEHSQLRPQSQLMLTGMQRQPLSAEETQDAGTTGHAHAEGGPSPNSHMKKSPLEIDQGPKYEAKMEHF